MEAIEVIRQGEKELADLYEYYDETAYGNQKKILQAFQECRVRDTHFHSATGYGYGDLGRDDLEEIYARVFKAEDAMVRSQIVSGTHAISACLFGLLRPGDKLLSVLGSPYDTLANIIGSEEASRGTLCEKGVHYSEVPLKADGKADYAGIRQALSTGPHMVLIQRSRGYSLRPALDAEDMKNLITHIRQYAPQTIIFVDNCYGEFTNDHEPIEIGADLMAGSLIKNPGGGLAPAGGYILGQQDLVEEISWYLTAPGLGKDLGASLIDNRLLYQGLFIAPHVVAQALKGATLMAWLFSKLGFSVFPGPFDSRGDIVQAICMNNAEEVIRLCQVVQSSSPVDSDVRLEYALLPGYTDQVVMAAGTFIQGSTIELSCDGPLRAPYSAYLQGGLTYEHCRYLAEQVYQTFAK